MKNDRLRNQELFELALSSAQMGTWCIDLQTNKIETSKSLAIIHGLSEIEENVFEAIDKFLDPEDAQRIKRHLEKAIEEGAPFREEYKITRPDGEVRWVFSQGSLKRDTDGKPLYFSGVLGDITDKKLAEFKAESERKKFESVFFNSRFAFVLFRGPQLRYEMINEEYKRIIGDRDVLGKTLYEAMPEIKDSAFPKMIESVFQNGEVISTFEVNTPLLNPATGSISERYFDTAFSRIKGETPEDTFVIGHAVEVTERVRNKNQILGLQERFARFTRAADLGVWYCDLPFADLIWDSQVKAHFWLSPDAHVTIDTFYERIHPEDRERTRLAIEHSIVNHSPYDIVYRTTNPHQKEQIKHIRAIGWTDYDEKGKPIRFDGVTLNVSQLYENETYFRTLIDTSPTMIWMTDAESKCTYLSQSWYDFTGRTPEQDLGFGWLENIHPDDLENTSKLYTEATENFGRLEIEYRLRRSDGEYRWAIDIGMPRFSIEGDFIGYIGTVIDIHDRKLFEEKLQDAVKARDEFLSIASHELKTPLTSLSLQTQLIQKVAEKSEDEAYSLKRMKKFVDHASRATSRLSHLVDDMLDISRINTGKLSIERENFNLGSLTQEIAERMEGEFEAAQCPLTLEVDENVQGNWDKFRIEQVISNLFSNAIKYGKRTPVHVTLKSDGENAVWSIKDRGPGIPEEAQSRIFDRFERAVNINEVTGLGLGLFICRQIIDMHEGYIGVKSTPGAGATFSFSLPL